MAAYATAGSKCEASINETALQSPNPFGVTSFQLLPPSRVR